MYNIRYYAIGHSYLRHGPFEGWQTDGFWGMAASEPSKDYFHRFQAKLSECLDCKIEAVAENHADFERCCVVGATRESYISSPGYKRMIEVLEEFKPNIISIYVGCGNTIAKDEKSLTLFYEVLYEMINKYKRDDAVVVCVGMNGAFEYNKPVAEKYGFLTADCRVIHEKKGRENPYYAFLDYPEYDEVASLGAVEFRTHPNDKGHDLIAKKMLESVVDSVKERISEGDFDEPYTYESFLSVDKCPKFQIDVTPSFLVRFNGFNVRQGEDFVSFSSAPETGAWIIAAGLHILPGFKCLKIEMSIECDSYPQTLELALRDAVGEHTYNTTIQSPEMTEYSFDISDTSGMITFLKVSPLVDDCLIKAKRVAFEK